MRALATATVLIVAAPAMPVHAADEGRWMKARDVQRIAKRREAQGRLPTAIECRHDPEADSDLVKPQVRMRWAPNPEGVRWRLKVTGRSLANDLLRAAYRRQGFSLVAKATFSTGQTDQRWMCELWHKTP